MTKERPESNLFESFSRELLNGGLCVRFQARGASMSPVIRDGEMVQVKPVSTGTLRRGDIVLVKSDRGFRLHRLVTADCARDRFITRGDNGLDDDDAVRGAQVLGVAIAKEVHAEGTVRCVRLGGIEERRHKVLAQVRTAVGQWVRATFAGSPIGAALATAGGTRKLRKFVGLLAVMWLLSSTYSHAQVAVDASTFSTAQLTGPGTQTLTFAHTTTATANRILIVGVSMNITNAPTTGLVGITYNGAALSFVGAHNDAGNTRRVEMWSLLAPANGTFNVVVSVNIPAAQAVGVVAGATTFTGVDQTVPLGTFVSADGAAGGHSQLDVPSVVNGMVIDTLAIGGNVTAAVSGPQVSRWNAASGGTATPDVTGVGSSRTGAPSVPISETFSAASNWSLGAVSLSPTAADIGVTTSVATVFLGNNTTYNITVFNNGPSPANNVVLTDTLAAGLTLISVTPSAGTTCVGTGPITCTLPTPLNSVSTATVAIVVNAATSGAYANTASVTDSGTPPDPNTGNNTFVAVATVQTAACANVSQGTVGTNLTGVLNTYYPGTASVAAGSTSITVGAATGAGQAIAAGNLLLVIQMQDASINTSNSVLYGNGSTGAGFTALNNAGNYEFVSATNAVGVGGGTLNIAGAGGGGGLVFAYNVAALSATKGQSTFQVVLIPQYTNASLNAAGLTASAWNGSSGGILALDVSGTLNLNGATVAVDSLGFRGGAGMQLTGGVAGANTDFLHFAPATYTGVSRRGLDASKGEGIAGTPLWVETGGTFLNTGDGYPNPAGGDGSMARGAPGNAGGGGTDADPAANTQNAGGGGGGNGGSGGFGGDSWNTNQSVGGEGGAAFPATTNRIALGGGGGAGTRNNSDGDNQASGASTGGGIIIIRANILTGTATLTANGAASYNGTANDAGGGGGAGGSIVVLSANGGEGGLTLQANGGRGGNAWQTQVYSLAQRHGPGGGGGGGVVLVSGPPAGISVNGGGSGLTLNPGVPYGSTRGNAGISVTNASMAQTSGAQSGAQCTPDMTLGKSHVGNFVRGSGASYTVPVSNVSLYGPSSGIVTVNDTLPAGLAPTTASGIGWACAVNVQTISCTRSDSLAAGGSYPSITLNANVAQAAPATETNTAIVAGGGEVNLANDTATDVATVVSSADLSVTNTASPNPVTAGSNITYTQVMTDNGPSAADNPTLVATIPANTSYVSATAPAGWNCVAGAGNVVCTTVSLAASTAATFTLVMKVNAGTANGTVISETATVSSSVSDPNSANNSATAVTVVGTTAQGELTVTDSASPNPVVAGNNITYTQIVSNSGTAAATTATLTEATPANTTFVSITPPAGWTCAGFPASPCTNPSVAAGSAGTFTVIFQVNAGTASGTTITDTVTVNAANQAFGPSSATATDIVATAGQADLALTTAATPQVIAGNSITYTQTITNNGPAASLNVSFTEPIPANTTFVSVSAPVGWSCTVTATVTCTNPSLAAGASADILVVVNVASTVTVATITANSSVTSATTTDPNPANNNTTFVTNVRLACDLAVTNSGVPSPVSAGSNITYTQVVTNSGPSNCNTATFTEATPANTTFVSVTPPAGWTCTGFPASPCTNPSVAPGPAATFTVVFNVNAGTVAGTLITDTATVASATQDTNLNNNTATVVIGVAGAGQADMSVTNSASPNPVNAGNNITYTQTVTNGGPATATTVQLTETLPANTTAQSLNGPAGWTCNVGTLTCTIPSLAANATATFTFVVKVNTSVASGTQITQTASVSSAVSDPNLTNNSASATVGVADSADLSVTNSASPVPVLAGSNITYTQVVTNAGPSTATNATFTEVTPPNTNFQSIAAPGGWACVHPAVGSPGTITCTNASFAPGSASFTVVLQVNAGTAAGTVINDTATASSSTFDPNLANNSATASDVVATAAQADLVAANSGAPSSVAAGSNVTYTQSVTNNGPAAATAPVTMTQNTPPNTNFQSITPPAGWTCGTVPPVGGTGTIICTDSGTLGVNATASFTLVLQVNANTPSGTFIGETVTASAGNIIPGLTTNSATATVVVANANSADMAIVKTSSQNPIPQGDALTYTLAVTNNGPATATNVTVTDPLPAGVNYLSSSSTQGTCSEAGGTVTCLLGTMANGATATVSIITLAGLPGIWPNTGSVTADQTDPILTNNSSTQIETITFPTKVQLRSFTAQTGKDKTGVNRVLLQWKTGGEAHNLGFNIYREQNGDRVRLNSSLIAGSALLMTGALPRHSGKTYAWIDTSASAGGVYWLEDVDVNGTRSMHGPVTVAASSSSTPISARDASLMLNQLNQSVPASAFGQTSHPVESALADLAPTQSQQQKQFDIAAHPAVKILVNHEGWYRVSQPQLVKEGLDPNVDPALLHLYAEAIEQPMQITGATQGPGGFGPNAAINVYGTDLDTLYSATRVYWLTVGTGRGARIHQMPPSSGSNQPPFSFPYTVEWLPRSTYFAALITPDGNNFFGPLVSIQPLTQTLHVPHLDVRSTAQARLELALQGIIQGVPHDVTIALNGATLGDLSFNGQEKGLYHVTLPPGLLLDGANTITLTAQIGDYDTSLVDYVRIVYPHFYAADSDQLKFTGRAGDELKVTGFDNSPNTVLDITDPDRPVELTPQIDSANGRYEFEVEVPWTTTNPAAPPRHTLLALADDRILLNAVLHQNHPSHWHSAQAGSEIVMVTHEEFASALPPLVNAHRAEGKSVAVVQVNDLYDEFNFGERTPLAIRLFLQTATKVWQTPPHYLLLNGRASLDPRNYLGFGHIDFVPTKIIPTSSLMTASDDWFSDFNDTGMPAIATGRLPVSTVDDATTVVGKVAAYEGQATNGPWTSNALMVADRNDTENFTQDTQTVQAQLPSSIQVTDVFATTLDVNTARQDIINGINSGQVLVNYLGHGSEEEWSGEDLFDTTTVGTLANGSKLPVFLIMDCLNGFFQDVYQQPLSVTLILAQNGGAVAVVSSSGLNQASPQTNLDKLLVGGALRAPYPALGDAILAAKAKISDPGVRKTFGLLGDPAMRVKPPAGSTAH